MWQVDVASQKFHVFAYYFSCKIALHYSIITLCSSLSSTRLREMGSNLRMYPQVNYKDFRDQ